MKRLAHGYKAFILVLIAFAGVQTGCGFHPRGEISLPNFITPIFVDLSASDDPLGRELMILLAASGADNLAGSAGEAETILTVSNVRQRKRLAAVDGQGRAREYELNYQFQYELKKASASDAGAEIIKANEIKLKRDLLFDPDNVLATGHEENALYAEMRKTAARLVFRQLSASQPTDAQLVEAQPSEAMPSETRPVLPQE